MEQPRLLFKQYVAQTKKGGPVVFDLPERYVPHQQITADGHSQIHVLGSGSFGVVIKCFDSKTNQYVAVKKMLDPFQTELLARRAYREFTLSRRLPPHRNVIYLVDAFTPATSEESFNNYYFVMKLMDFDLSQFWHGVVASAVPHTHLSYLLYQMLCAVNHLHRLGIIHRDLKPANMAVLQEGFELRLLDFGLARCFATVKMSQYVYTRWYRAPEVVLDAEYTTKADIWAVGCIFAEILLGKVYLRGDTHIDQWRKISAMFGMPNEAFLSKLQPQVVGVIRTMTPPSASQIPFEIQFPDSIFPPTDSEHPEIFCASQARDLLSKLLVMNPDHRLSAEDALKHPYVSQWRDLADISGELPPFHYEEPRESTKEHWKQMLWQEISNYMAQR